MVNERWSSSCEPPGASGAIETRCGSTAAEPAPAYPGEAGECAGSVREVLPDVCRLASISVNLSDVELTVAAQSLAVMMQQAEAALVAVTAEAIERGAVDRSTAAGAGQWVQRLSSGEDAGSVLGAQTASLAGPLVRVDPVETEHDSDGSDGSDCSDGSDVSCAVAAGGLEPAHAARVARLADACRSPLNARLAAAVTSGAVNTTIANAALFNTAKVKAVVPTAGVDEIYGWFLSLAPGDGARAVRELTKRILAEYGQEVLDEKEDALQRHESLSWTDLPEGMVRFTGDFSADHAEVIKHAIGALSAPSPVSECCEDPHHRHDPGASRSGEPDLRTPGKRRADALLMLIMVGAQAVDGDGSVKTFGTARLVVTIDYGVLAKALAGLGVTDGGVGVTPDTVRQLACDAEIIPMVLGSKSQPLNVGRKVRLVDKELRRAVIQRDRHCTFDGCTRPPVMCEVHHVQPWWTGGETSLANSALLCGTHHRIVHRDNLTATVTDETVTWHHQKKTASAA